MSNYHQFVIKSAEVAEHIQKTCQACFAGSSTWSQKGVGCCGSCARTFGYLDRMELSKEEQVKLKQKYNYDKKRGFLGETGCKLPRHLRSPTCLHFVCRPAQQKLLPELKKWCSNPGIGPELGYEEAKKMIQADLKEIV